MYCQECAAENLESAIACTKCGRPLFGVAKQKPKPSSTTLWSPDKAAFFSIFFTPIFGAIIHALNWQKLGQKKQATQSWLWAVAVFIAFNIVVGYGYSKQYDYNSIVGLFKLTQLASIVIWYFLSARKQSKYVVNHFKDGYTRNGWFNPFCIAIVIWGALSWLGS
ncbi:MAG: hypothetical protein ACKE5M_07180 [Methylophilaceae bacterium]